MQGPERRDLTESDPSTSIVKSADQLVGVVSLGFYMISKRMSSHRNSKRYYSIHHQAGPQPCYLSTSHDL